MNPLISVIIPTFNRKHTLKRAIESVQAQTYTNWELLIVDDGSSDDTFSLLNEFSFKNPTFYFQTPNRGVSASRNLGATFSQGTWLSFLDSDDEWLPQKLSLQCELTDNHKGYPLIHGEEIWYRNGVRVNPMKKHKKQGGDIFSEALSLCCISPSTALIKRNFFQQMGGFKENYPVCEDYDLWLRICSHHEVGFIETPIINKYGGHQDQLSKKFVAMDYWRVLSISSLIESKQLRHEQLNQAQLELVKKCKILIKGYIKHNNTKQLTQIQTLLEKTLQDLNN